MAGKQAKILSKSEVSQLLDHAKRTRHPERNQVMVLLSLKAGLRAKEIANLTWSMVCDPSGNLSDALHLPDRASKGQSGRIIPINKVLKESLARLKVLYAPQPNPEDPVIKSERGMSLDPCNVAHWFRLAFKSLRLEGCSSHSGRRTFITNAAKKITQVGGSLRDVQALAGHASLAHTQKYIEHDTEARKKIVEIV